MAADWSDLSDELQLALAREALTRAMEIVAQMADKFAAEVTAGNVSDRGGADALRLFAAVIRTNRPTEPSSVVGHA